MTGSDKFLGRVEAFLERTGMAPSRFGLLTCNDANLLWQLRQGREPRRATVAAIVDFMARHRGRKAVKRRPAPKAARRRKPQARSPEARTPISP